MEFIAKAEAEPFRWGEFDCCLWLADWGRELTGIDGGAAWRGRYSSALGCERFLHRQGGVQRVVGLGAMACSMTPASLPLAGAVGVVECVTFKGVREVGAIFTGQRWIVLRRGGGILAVDTPAIAAWGL